MDKETVMNHLALTEANVALGERHLAEQHSVIDELTRGGHDTSQAKELLATFEQTQQLHVEDKDRLRKELEEASRS
ncbi:MAG: hypothetical protein JO051_08050 [Acidobacteriaceae bacterium]|nr:hypothetical protein [Acidobacteriaceae bacterium]